MTGDFKKEDTDTGAVATVPGGLGKPADRQIYAYNLSTGLVCVYPG